MSKGKERTQSREDEKRRRVNGRRIDSFCFIRYKEPIARKLLNTLCSSYHHGQDLNSAKWIFQVHATYIIDT